MERSSWTGSSYQLGSKLTLGLNGLGKERFLHYILLKPAPCKMPIQDGGAVADKPEVGNKQTLGSRLPV